MGWSEHRPIAASERAQLAALARVQAVEFQVLLTEFVSERLLARLGSSPHVDRFVHKGATLFRLWGRERRRATWDLDLLGHGSREVAEMVALARELFAREAGDGVVFEAASLRGERIRSLHPHGGVRLRLRASLAGAQVPLQVDVGFGDVVVPAPRWATFPTLLGHVPISVLAYPREAVVAEKLEALVSRGMLTTRMKDVYDLYCLGRSFGFDGASLTASVLATFTRRGTPIPPGEPQVLAAGALEGGDKALAWAAFYRRCRLREPPTVTGVGAQLRAFLLPVLAAAAGAGEGPGSWTPGGPWRPGVQT